MSRARALAVAALAVPAVALAHAVVYPRSSTPGAYEKYVLRVPNEKDTARTTRVEIHFPAGLRVVSFSDVPGWTLQVTSDTAGHVTGATWTGSLVPERFVEFPFVAVNPRTTARLVWPVSQTYSDGERVEWAGPENSDTPASVTTIAPVMAPRAPTWPGYVSAAALVLALVSLGLAVRGARPRAA
jgi:YD repeat-containing protein